MWNSNMKHIILCISKLTIYHFKRERDRERDRERERERDTETDQLSQWIPSPGVLSYSSTLETGATINVLNMA